MTHPRRNCEKLESNFSWEILVIMTCLMTMTRRMYADRVPQILNPSADRSSKLQSELIVATQGRHRERRERLSLLHWVKPEGVGRRGKDCRYCNILPYACCAHTHTEQCGKIAFGGRLLWSSGGLEGEGGRLRSLERPCPDHQVRLLSFFPSQSRRASWPAKNLGTTLD